MVRLIGVFIIGSLVGGVVGAIAGVIGGDQNAYIDFCMDNGTRRYIQDTVAREASCG